MRKCAGALLAAVSITAALSGVNIAAQSQAAREEALRHIAAAKQAAGYEVSDLFDHLCSRLLIGSTLPFGRIVPPDNDRDPKRFHTEPVKVFDNLYYVGEKMQHGASPSAWAITTSEGIILIDALFGNSVEDEIVGGLKKMKLDPAEMKYVILSHGHVDHIGGARFLQDTFKPRVLMGAADWDMVEKNQNFRDPKPKRDIAAVDGQKVTLGGETITLYLTPGHSPGTLSMLIPVKDHGQPHLAALWGGTGMQTSAEEYNRNARRFREIVTQAGADVMLSTHPQLDKSDVKLRLLEKRQPGDPHPYVVGNDVVRAYLTVATECSAAAQLLPEDRKGTWAAGESPYNPESGQVGLENNMRRILVVCVPVLVTVLALARVHAQKTPAEAWPNYQHNSNFSPLTQITPDNVNRLTKAWTFNYGGGTVENVPFVGLDYRFQVQPLVIDDVMYFSTPASERDPNLLATVTALEPETGRVIWQYKSPRRIHGRGLAYWKGTAATGPRVFFATDKGYLMGLDIKTGQLAAGFGKGGEVDVYAGVASPAVPENRRDTFTVPNPVTVYKNLLITGARPGELPPPQPRGDIRAWDAATGKLVWSFHTVPWPGEPHHEDWPGDAWKDRSGCNVWSNLTADETTGLVFGATGDANRAVKGSNLYCNSLIALDAQTGKLKWFHQLVHHDASDWDMPTPPILMDVKINGRSVPAVLQTGKLHFVYMFDRVTGKPLYEFLEKPVHRSGTPDDENPPTQPVPVKTPPTGLLGMTRANINKMTPEIEKFCTDFWDQNHLIPSGPFDRPAQDEAMVTFGAPVGAWGPLSYNPQLGYVFMNVTTAGSYHPAGAPVPRGFGLGNPGEDGPPGGGRAGAAPGAGAAAGGGRGGGGGGGTGAFSYRLPSGKTVSCVAPPYGSLVAVDANSGDIAWSVPLGINEELAELGEVGLKSGIRNIGGSIATASGLVFIGATVDRRFRAFDAKTGKELWVTELPANGNATPITYMGKDGAQYVVIAAGGGGPAARNMAVSDSVVAFKLGPAQGRGVAVAAGAGPQGRGAGAQQSDPWPGQKHLLAVADVLSGFHHDSISHALATVEQIGRRSAAYATMIRTDSQLITKGQIAGQGRYEGRGVNARTLSYYDAIFMLPSGFGTMTEQQKADLLSFVRDEGKGLIVGHATGVAFTNWPEFGEMVGGYMDSEFNANAKVIVEDPKFPGAMAWGAPTFMFNDQHPVFKAPYSRDKVHVIMRLDPESLSAADRARRPDGDFPVVWARQYGKGRVFNVGWGHPETTWDDPHFQTMMLEGIKWALGVTPADVTPRPLSKPPTSPALAQAVQKDPLPEDAGKAAVVKMCGECHAVEQAVSVRGTEKDWRDVVDVMIDRGASGTPEDIRAVVAYLSKHFGPK